jgi:single-stranded-DNA-specific exonuclease
LLSLGTVADVMPLLGENRFLISLGLSQLAAGRCRPGLTALLAESDTADKPPTAATLSFRLAPRINAAGRLGQADTAVRLLLTRDPAEAMELARVLCRKNRERQELETEIWIQAQRSLSGEPPELPIVLAGDGWHEGVIGIAASRLVDAFHLPAVMICLDGERGKGSCRSLGGFNLFEALSACSDCLEGFGGHAMAAGLTIRRDRIDELRQRLGDYYLSHRTEDEAALELDLAVDEPGLLSEESVRSLEKLEPCGNGNPQPLLYLDAAELTSVTPIGGGKHLRLTVRKFGCSYTCLFFSRRPDELGAEPGQWVDLAFTPQINEFRGLRSLQLVLTDLRLHDGAALCDRLLADGAALAGEVAAFLPDRGDFARLWRRLAVLGGQFRGGLHELAACFGCEEERVCICLAVLRDLSLISVTRAGEMIYVDQSLPAEKADLEKSELLRRLRGL